MVVLFDLPTDITYLLFRYLGIHDVLNLRQTCKTFRLITQSRVVWQSLLTKLTMKQIPIPRLLDRPFDSLSSTELEQLARGAWALRQNWVSKSPVVRKTLIIKLDPIPYEGGGVPPSFAFVEKTGRRYLLTLTVTGRARNSFVYDLQCWDLEASPPRCIAERKVSRRYLAVNKNLDSLASLAVLSPSIEILGIDYSAEDSLFGFYTVSKLQNSTQRPVALNDSLLVIQDDRQQLYLHRIHKDDHNYVELRSEQPIGPVLEVMIQDEVIIVFRSKTLSIFSAANLDIDQREIYPIAQHVFQWNLDSVSLSPQRGYSSKRKYPVINILIRFGSLLPWPVNLLHHFILLPNPEFDMDSPHSTNNIPYNNTPIMKRAIGSPVRLFARYSMAVGSRGTAIFIDTHTEDYFGRGDVGQRLAGSYAQDVPAAEGDEWHLSQEDSTDVESTMDSSVFGYTGDEDWIRVAVDEEEGRIAVGCLEGAIEIREYA